MCIKGKCLFKTPVKKTCLVLSIINAIANGTLLCWWFYIWYRYYSYRPEDYDSNYCGFKLGGICWGRQRLHKRDAIDDYLHRGFWLIPVTAFLTLLTLLSAIFFLFAVLLCYGIIKRRIAFLKAYFVFGVIATVLAALCSLVRLVFREGDLSAEASGFWGLFACALHSLFLLLVVLTHNEMLVDAIPSPIQLQEVTTILPTAPSLHLLEDDDFKMEDIGFK